MSEAGSCSACHGHHWWLPFRHLARLEGDESVGGGEQAFLLLHLSCGEVNTTSW